MGLSAESEEPETVISSLEEAEAAEAAVEPDLAVLEEPVVPEVLEAVAEVEVEGVLRSEEMEDREVTESFGSSQYSK